MADEIKFKDSLVWKHKLGCGLPTLIVIILIILLVYMCKP